MTVIELGREARTAERREYLRLSDAMAEALGENNDTESTAEPVQTRLVATRLNTGVRRQRCGGGVRIIRRQGKGAY